MVDPGPEVDVCCPLELVDAMDESVAAAPVVVDAGVFVEPDPQAARTSITRRRTVPVMAFSGRERNERVRVAETFCALVILIVLFSRAN